MLKVLYCTDKAQNRKNSFLSSFDNISLDCTSRISDAGKGQYSLIVVDDSFLRRRKESCLYHFKDKICFVHFPKKNSTNLEMIKQYGFFDCFSNEDSKLDVIFKLERASNVLELRDRLDRFKDRLDKKDKRIEKMILTDPLTGCYNWRYFLHRVHAELKRSRRYLYSVSFIGVDVDHFRQVNELYGIKVADVVVKKLARIFREHLREEDVIARWRGDEFFIIAPHLENEEALAIAQKIRNRISVYKFKYKNLSLRIKVSIGVVSSPQDNVFNIRDVIGALNKCLINAKRKGGNSVILYSSPQIKQVSEQKKKANISELRSKIEKMDTLLTRDLLEMIYGFARAIEAKDSYTGEHVEYTSAIAEEIARYLKLPRREVTNVKHAAVLHDLGKVGIEGKILSKRGPLSVRERETIKSHPSIAAEILREIHVLREAIPAILYHHERYDGKGYPLGLKGDEIPLSARIVSVADVYQALISDRPYRRAYTRKKALEMIKKESGSHFDPKIVKIFLRVIRKIDEKA